MSTIPPTPRASSPRKPHISEAFVIEQWHNLIDDECACSICGERFEVGQRAIDVPFGDESRLQCTVHLGCAINGNEVEL